MVKGHRTEKKEAKRVSGPFVHLHTHSEFSALDSIAKVGAIVQGAADDGAPAVAITDHGSLGGLWKLREKASENGIKPLPGVELYLAFGSRFARNAIDAPSDDSDPDEGEARSAVKQKRYMHLTVLAANRAGWHNLIAVCNEAQKTWWYRPRADMDLLREHAEGLVVLTGCLGGPVAGPLARSRAALADAGKARTKADKDAATELARTERAEAERALDELVDVFGQGNVYVEIMDHGIDAEQAILSDLVDLARSRDLMIVATNDCHYIHEDQADAHEAWLAMGTRKTLADENRFRFHGTGYHLRTASEMWAVRDEPWWHEACANTVKVAERISADTIPQPRQRLPHFPIPDGFDSSAAYLRHLVSQGARRRYGSDPDRPGKLPAEVNERIRFEFGVIHDFGFEDYFLIVADMIDWARSDRGLPTSAHPDGEPGMKTPILVGPGRGSAGGAALAFVLGITNVDPIANGLLFERFLDPTRAGMPDIDVDFEQARRAEVLAYLAVKYGRDHVVVLGTFGIDRTRAALKDAARVLGTPEIGDDLSRVMPMHESKPRPLAYALTTGEDDARPFQQALEAAGPAGQAVVEIAAAFENVVRNEGVHACGVIVGDEPLGNLVPIRKNMSKSAPVDALGILHWDGKDAEKFGLLKVDVLGLRTLDIIARTQQIIAETTGEVVDADTLTIGDGSPRDRATWALLSDGATAGVFQLESPGMRRLCQDVAPHTLDDLSSLVALYRPGPMAAGSHEHYAARKSGQEDRGYAYLTTDQDEAKALETVLGVTYGLPVFQEQLMMLSTVIGGLEAGDRNALRKAFSKKDAALMEQVRSKMFAGGLAGQGTSGVTFSTDTLERVWKTFEGSASYLFNKSHSTAYGVIAYQTAYLKASWPAAFGAATLACTKGDEKRSAILQYLTSEGVNVLAPDVNRSGPATSTDDGAVRIGLTEVKEVGAAGAEIVAERDANGPFLSLADLSARVPGVSTTALTGLIESGAADAFGPRLGQAMVVRAVGHVDPVHAEWGAVERAARQRARLGFAVGEHPLRALPELTRHRMDGTPVRGLKAVDGAEDQSSMVLLSVLAAWEERAYRGGIMVSMRLEGSDRSTEAVMWNREREALGGWRPRIGDPIAVRAQVSERVRVIEEIDEVTEETFERTESVRQLKVTHIEPVPVPVSDAAAWSLTGPSILADAHVQETLDLSGADTGPQPTPEPAPGHDPEPAPPDAQPAVDADEEPAVRDLEPAGPRGLDHVALVAAFGELFPHRAA